MIVMAQPGFEDVREDGMVLCSGKAEEELRAALGRIGKTMNDVWLTARCKYVCRGAKPTTADFTKTKEIFDYEVEMVKPKLIITLGGEAFKAVMGKNIKQGSFVGEIIDSPYGKVMPCHSLGLITAVDPKLRNEFRRFIKYGFDYATDSLDFTPFEYVVVSDPEVSRQFTDHYLSKGDFSIGYDAEWFGKKFTDDEVMYSFQYSCEPHKAIVLDISPDGVTENRELLDTVKPLLESPNADRMGWNIRADDKRLLFRGFNIPEETIGFDGMKAMAFYDSRISKGLEQGIRLFTNYEHYYVDLAVMLKSLKMDYGEMSKLRQISPDVFFRYAAGDAVSHYTACINMRNWMKENLPKSTLDYWFEVYLPLSNYLLDMELTGIPIDIEVMEEMTRKYKLRYDQLLSDLQKLLIEQDLMKEFPNQKAKKGEPEFEFNPNSNVHKPKLLYKLLKCEPAFYTYNKKPRAKAWYEKQRSSVQRRCTPCANGSAISSIRHEMESQLKEDPDNEELEAKYQIICTLLKLLKVGVFANKFLNKKGVDLTSFEEATAATVEDEDPLQQSYWHALHTDGKIHADFFECLNNFRASSRVNVQNPASKVLAHIPWCFEGALDIPPEEDNPAEELRSINLGDDGGPTILTPPRNLRHIFYPGEKDWYYSECDVAGADLAIMAFLSRDPAFITDIRKGGFHQTKMREYFQDNTLTKKEKAKYVIAKSITFRVSYTSQLESAVIPIQAEIFAENGLRVEQDLIRTALKTWEKKYPTYMRYRQACNDEVESRQRILNGRGFPFLFEHTEEFGIKAGWLNESLAYPVASELALFMWEVAVKIKKQFQKDGVWMKWIKPCNTIHDAHHWLLHKDLMKDNYYPEVVKQYFTKDVSIVTGDKLGIELTIEDRWKGDESIFEAETMWDFQAGELSLIHISEPWVWKE